MTASLKFTAFLGPDSFKYHTSRKTFDPKILSRTLNVTYRDIPTHEIVKENGFSLEYASKQIDGEGNSVKNHYVVQVLEEWYDLLTDKFRPSSGFHADPVDDSLEDRDKSGGAVCIGGDSCCSDANPCREGAGDCDLVSQCFGDLLCGEDNCNLKIKTFDWRDDCCYWPGMILT